MVAVICLDNCYVSFINLFVNRYEKRLFLQVRQFFFVPDQLNKYITLKYIILPVHCFCVFQTLTPGDSSPPCMTFMVAAKDKGDGLWLVANVLGSSILHLAAAVGFQVLQAIAVTGILHAVWRVGQAMTQRYITVTHLYHAHTLFLIPEKSPTDSPPTPIKQELIVFPQGSPSAARKYVLYVAHTFL
jgi:hypothetical protein